MTGDYNEVLYPSYLATQCSPDQLAVMARMKGLETAPPDACRMLELGCGDGASLIAYAYALPGSEFVGVDLAARPVAIGNAKIAALGLKNVTLHCGDVMEVDASWGEFDYIFAHGFFSWVPEPVRERALEIGSALLKPDGVTYLSYNAYPGSYQRDMLRSMLQIHTGHVADPAAKIRQSLGLIDFVRSAPFKDTPYHRFFEGVHEHRSKGPLEVLLYDELGGVNQPFFFHEFARLAAGHGLQYLNEACFDNLPGSLSPPLEQALASLGGDVVTREQYLDFLAGRAFRQTLLCHRGHALDHRRRWEPLAQLYFASPVLLQESKEDDPAGSRRFSGLHGSSAVVSHQSIWKALVHLNNAWPAIVSFDDLAVAAEAKGNGGLTAALGEHLLEFAESGFVKVHAHPFRLAAALPEKATASRLARSQLGERFLANLFCEAVTLTGPLGGPVLARLDGSRTRADLAAELDAALAAQKPDSEAARAQIAGARAQLGPALDKQLNDILELGLLEA